MKENYLINIESRVEQDGDVDTIHLSTRGSFTRRNGNFFIRYREPEGNGYEGSVTTVKVEDASRVSMTRVGGMHSQLVIELGKRHICHYDSEYGGLSFGVAADAIDNQLTENGGNVVFSYMLDTGNTQISRNQVAITVSEAEATLRAD